MENKTRSIRLGIIGCGHVTENFHLPALKSLPNIHVSALSDVNETQLNRVADHFHIGYRYKDPYDMINNPDIEAIAICVPPQFHFELGMATLDSDKHLFIEKPLSLSLDECNQLIMQANPSSKKVMVGFNLRWHRHLRKAREIIQEGKLGQVELVRTVITSNHKTFPDWRKQRKLGGGVLFEVAVHHFDLIRFLLNSEVEEVFAITRSENWDDESAIVNTKICNGVLASSVFSIRSSHSNEIEIFGQAGSLRISFYRFDGLDLYTCSSLPGDLLTRLSKTYKMLKELPKAATTIRLGGVFKESYRAEWQHFIDTILNNKEIESSLEDGKRALEIVLSAVQSAHLGKPIKIA